MTGAFYLFAFWWVSVITLPLVPSLFLLCLLSQWFYIYVKNTISLNSFSLNSLDSNYSASNYSEMEKLPQRLSSFNAVLGAFFVQCRWWNEQAQQIETLTLWAHQFDDGMGKGAGKDYRRLLALLHLYQSKMYQPKEYQLKRSSKNNLLDDFQPDDMKSIWLNLSN